MQSEVIVTDSDRCKRCYACVRNCPVKAVRIKDGKADIIQERCIQCGYCLRYCSRNAKIVSNPTQEVRSYLADERNTIALLAPSFIVGFHPMSVERIMDRFRMLGFDEVWETSIGAAMVTEEVARYALDKNRHEFIGSACPAWVSLIEKHVPLLTKRLIPVCSPMIAAARAIRKIDQQARVVFIGPCIAKKSEARNPRFTGLIDAVLTFSECMDLMENSGVKNADDKPDFRWVTSKKGRLMPIAGDVFACLDDKSKDRSIAVEGAQDCVELTEHLQKQPEGRPYAFCDPLMCRGCVDGPGIEHSLNMYEKRQLLIQFANDPPVYEYAKPYRMSEPIDLSRGYDSTEGETALPTERQINRILASIDKYAKEDELNCGACGYATCREKAIAVHRGIAEPEMCFPYLVERKNQLYEEQKERLSTIEQLHEQLHAVFESSYDGLVLSDTTSRVIRANAAYKKMVGMDEVPTHMSEIEAKYAIDPCVTPLVIREQRRVTMLQRIKNGKTLVVTGNPVLDARGRLAGVVENARDVEELNQLNRSIHAHEGVATMDKDVWMMTKSQSFESQKRLIEYAKNCEQDVLLYGERGVGKEQIAEIIHDGSTRKNEPLIKIDCAKIPKNLLESECFGVKTGTFFGENPKTRKGWFERAHKGTLVLHHVDALPMEIQQAILDVQINKSVTRIGEQKSFATNVRMIATLPFEPTYGVRQGLLNEALYKKLSVLSVRIPALRERVEDVKWLAIECLRHCNKKYGLKKVLSAKMESVFFQYDWPGNIRELLHTIERLVVVAKDEVLMLEDLPTYFLDEDGLVQPPILVNGLMPLAQAKDELEKIIIKRALKTYQNTYKVAKVLGVNQSTIVRKAHKFEGRT